jgi:hypothetical protein
MTTRAILLAEVKLTRIALSEDSQHRRLILQKGTHMSKSVTIRFPEDGDTVPSDFTADGVVCARMDAVDLTLSGGGTNTLVSADGRWSFDYLAIADGAYTLTAENTAGPGIVHSINFTVDSTAVSARRARARTTQAKPAKKKKAPAKSRAKGKKKR